MCGLHLLERTALDTAQEDHRQWLLVGGASTATSGALQSIMLRLEPGSFGSDRSLSAGPHDANRAEPQSELTALAADGQRVATACKAGTILVRPTATPPSRSNAP